VQVETLSRLIPVIVDACRQESGWDALADEFTRVFDCDVCSVQILDIVTGNTAVVGKSSRFDDELAANYCVWHYREDPWIKAALSSGAEGSSLGEDLVADTNLLGTPFFQEFCTPLGLRHALCAYQDMGNNCFAVLCLYRSAERGIFTAQEKKNFDHLVPALKNAGQLWVHVQNMCHSNAMSFSAIDNLSLGLAVVGTGGIVRFSNRVMDRILGAGQGITLRHGRLQLDDQTAQQKLNKAIEEAYQSILLKRKPAIADAIIPARDKQDRPLSLLVSRIQRNSSSSKNMLEMSPAGPVAAVYVNYLEERRGPRHDAISKLYGLTPAETRLVRSLLNGDRLHDHAERCGISLHTVKAHLKQIFLKTGHTRQGDLVRDILFNPVLRIRA